MISKNKQQPLEPLMLLLQGLDVSLDQLLNAAELPAALGTSAGSHRLHEMLPIPMDPGLGVPLHPTTRPVLGVGPYSQQGHLPSMQKKELSSFRQLKNT